MQCLCHLIVLSCLLPLVRGSGKNTTFELLLPPTYDTRFIMKTFLELQRQWCPPWKFKKIYILSYSNHPFSEEILTEILKINQPPKILSTDSNGITYWTYMQGRCAILMMSGLERLKVDPSATPIYYGSRYFIFQPKMERNPLLEDIAIGRPVRMDKAYNILYNQTAVEILHKNYFLDQMVSLDPHNIRVPDDLQNLNGRNLRLAMRKGFNDVATFDIYIGKLIAERRNATFDVVEKPDYYTDYWIENIGVPLQGGTEQVVALGSTFLSVLVPRSKPKPIISVLVDPFDHYSWMMIFVMVFALALVLSLFGKYLGKLTIVEVALELIMCILSGPSRTYGGWFENHLITVLCLMTIVIVSSYQSLIISYLSATRYFPEINSLKEIQEKCVFLKESLANMVPVRSTYATSMHGFQNYSRCYFFAGRDSQVLTDLQLRRTGTAVAWTYVHENMRIADHTFMQSRMLYYFLQKSLIREMFPFYMTVFAESGLFNQYYRNLSFSVRPPNLVMITEQSFTVEDLSVVWCLFAAGMAVSGCWFVIEIVYHSCGKFSRRIRMNWQNRSKGPMNIFDRFRKKK
uniref:Ionotropic glutamate receptor C-terminal domain-containing protein n=2 Tax=Anopheles albimanus TaxID=7167 RepID=A0A182FKH7_ANOAL